MYQRFFGLDSYPFTSNLDFEYFFEQASRQDILDALLFVIERGDSIIKVTGEVGVGKTTLLRHIATSLTPTHTIVYIASPNLSPKDLLHAIGHELGLTNLSAKSKYELVELIREHVIRLFLDERSVVILLDEAQSLPVDSIEELRLISNFETNQHKLLQLVLFGQQELDLTLENSALRPFLSRISYSISIPALNEKEVHAYLNHRMRVASYSGLDFFSPKLSKKIHELSKGLPRTINVLADQLLMAAFGMGDRQLSKKHFGNIDPKTTNNHNPLWPLPSPQLIALIVLSIVTASLIYLFLFVQNSNNRDLSAVQLSHQQVYPVDSIKEFNTDEKVLVTDVDRPVELQKDLLIDEVNEVKSKTVVNEISVEVEADKATADYKDYHQQHIQTVNWLKSLPKSSYLIQVSTINMDSYHRLVKALDNNKKTMSMLRFMLVFNKDGSKVRIKTIYNLHSTSFSSLKKQLDGLPKDIKADGAFIVNLGDLLKVADFSSQYIKSRVES